VPQLPHVSIAIYCRPAPGCEDDVTTFWPSVTSCVVSDVTEVLTPVVVLCAMQMIFAMSAS
jgi:hypothetical protein